MVEHPVALAVHQTETRNTQQVGHLPGNATIASVKDIYTNYNNDSLETLCASTRTHITACHLVIIKTVKMLLKNGRNVCSCKHPHLQERKKVTIKLYQSRGKTHNTDER